MPVDPSFRTFLFADQDLDALAAATSGTESEARTLVADAFAELASIAPLRDEDQTSAFRALIARDDLPSRAEALAWRALRALGRAPADEDRWSVLGAVLEMPMDSGSDVAAAYDDGTARYLSHSGSAVVWDDLSDATNELIGDFLLAAAESDVNFVLVDRHDETEPVAVRITLIMPAGLRQWTAASTTEAGAADRAVAAALALMTHLINLALHR